MLDSGCMMLDDQGMAEEWIVRVQGKEYGPADIDTLREWKREGRLLPENEARNTGADLWSTAAAIPGLFDAGASEAAIAGRLIEPPLQTQHRTFGQILAETFQIYRKGFFQFLGLTLLVLLPSVCSQLTTPLMKTTQGSYGDLGVLAGGLFSFFMFMLSLAMFFALALLILQVWMFGWFFITVLFWQQFAVLENAGFIDSLRGSRNLARSGQDLPLFERPLWRGAFIASLWFALVLIIAVVSEWTTLHQYFNQLMTTQDPQTLLHQLTEAQQARGFDISAFVLNLLQRILQPLLGIAFVMLY